MTPNQVATFWINCMIWHLPEIDYNRVWYEKTMRSNVLPYIPGI